MTAPTRDAIAAVAVAPYYQDEAVTLLHGDALEVLRQLPSESVQMVCTSPPYYSLRDYGVEGQIGLEDTPDAYVARLVGIFREVRRVLRPDGTCWLNLGDSYAHGTTEIPVQRGTSARPSDAARYAGSVGERRHGMKPKDLMGIPWMTAFALRADGWWLRSEVIWHKPNPMPESVDDRPTKAHEQVFLLSKSADYFYDATAIREPHAFGDTQRGIRNGLSPHADHGHANHMRPHPDGRNKRSVWTIPTQSYEGAHFATFPEALVTPCILAGTSERGACPACGTPWRRVIERTDEPDTSAKGSTFDRGKTAAHQLGRAQAGERTVKRATGWEAGCRCGHATTVPCVVLDPFSGSGTTVAVAKRLGRHGIGIDLNADYHALATRRLAQSVMQLEGAAG